MYTWILLQIKFIIIISCSTKLDFIIRQVIKFFTYAIWKSFMKDDFYILISLRTRYIIGAIDPFAILRSSIFSLSISIIGLVVILFETCSYCTIFSATSSTLIANYRISRKIIDDFEFFDRDLGINSYYKNIFCLELVKSRACKD